jgi:hypothetical protein
MLKSSQSEASESRLGFKKVRFVTITFAFTWITLSMAQGKSSISVKGKPLKTTKAVPAHTICCILYRPLHLLQQTFCFLTPKLNADEYISCALYARSNIIRLKS